jgi:hypothetical protein
LKENVAKYRPSHYSLKYKDILPDAVGWDTLGPELQRIFTTILKLSHILDMLPLDPVLTGSRQSMVRSLAHLLSHLPFPNSVTQTINMVEVNKPRTKAMAAYLFGWKVKEVISLLRAAYQSENSDILPCYFKAEICQTDSLSYDCLKFALHGLRNMAIAHSDLNSDSSISASEFVPPGVDWYGLENDSSSDSDAFGSDIEVIPLSKKRNTQAISESGDHPSHPVKVGKRPMVAQSSDLRSRSTGSNLPAQMVENTALQFNSRVRVQQLSAAAVNSRMLAGMKRKWKLPSTGLPVWQPVATTGAVTHPVCAGSSQAHQKCICDEVHSVTEHPSGQNSVMPFTNMAAESSSSIPGNTAVTMAPKSSGTAIVSSAPAKVISKTGVYTATTSNKPTEKVCCNCTCLILIYLMY